MLNWFGFINGIRCAYVRHTARLRKLSFMLGGPDHALDRLTPLFQAMGQHVFRLGLLGPGMTRGRHGNSMIREQRNSKVRPA